MKDLIPVTVREFSKDTQGNLCKLIELCDYNAYGQGDYFFNISTGYLYCYKMTKKRNKLMWKLFIWNIGEDGEAHSPFEITISSNAINRIAKENGIAVERIKSVPFIHELYTSKMEEQQTQTRRLVEYVPEQKDEIYYDYFEIYYDTESGCNWHTSSIRTLEEATEWVNTHTTGYWNIRVYHISKTRYELKF